MTAPREHVEAVVLMRPLSPEVVAAVERAMLGHVLCDCLPDSATRAEMRSHAVDIGYAAVVEVITPGDGPWLKTLKDSTSTPWAQEGRVAALHQTTRHELDAGWRPGEGDDQ